MEASTRSADSIVLQVINRRISNADLPDDYTGMLYSKSLQRLNRLPKNFLKKDIAHELHINPKRKGIINLSEYIAKVQFRANDYLREQVTGVKIADNSRDLFDFNKSPQLQVDFYRNTLRFNGFNAHAFLSPIADNALKHYHFDLIAQFKDGDKLVDEIRVMPIHADEHLFSGTICIVEKECQLYSISVQAARNARLDFIDSIRINQQFVPVEGQRWMMQVMTFNFYGKFTGFNYSGLFLRAYQELHPDTGAINGPKHELFYGVKPSYHKADTFWTQNRLLPLTSEESRFYDNIYLSEKHKKDKHLADSLQNRNNRFRPLLYILRGYTLHDYSDNSYWTIPSPYNMVFYNTIEGWGIDLKPKYVKVFDTLRSLTLIPEVRYGFSDHRFNANVFANYVYNPFKQASVYARIGSDFLDLNNTGTISLFLNSLNTLFLGNNYLKLYQSRFVMAGTDGEVSNGILLNGQFEYADRRSLFNTTQHTFNRDSVYLTSNNPLDPNGNTPLFPHYQALSLRGSATFTFDQDYMITPAGKFILPNPYPRLRINYREGIPVLGSSVNYNFLSVDIFQDGLSNGIYGTTSYFISAGKFLSARNLYYPDFQQFNGGESFFFNATTGSFHFLNYYTYSTDKAYLEIHAEHNFEGLLLSRVPLLKYLNLQEIVGGSYLMQGTLPHYEEVYVGLKRTVVRLDYGLAFGRFTQRVQGFWLVYNL